MIPLKLQVKNFLSYGSDIQTIDFSPYSFICLSGKNGHGKSALLDAITWALWGQARKITGVAKSDDAIIRLGSTHMMVGMQFMCNGQEYRVRREYIKTSSKPYVTLDIGVYDADKKGYVPMGGKTIKSNQLVLDGIIRLDFDSFCNSAFLRQGQSNEFSKKSPKERKDILGAILGLDIYESVRALASEKMRQSSAERLSMQAILDRMALDLRNITTIDERFIVLNDRFKAVETQEKKLSERISNLDFEKAAIALERRKEHEFQVHLKDLVQQEKQAVSDLKIAVDEWRSVHRRQLSFGQSVRLEMRKKEVERDIQSFQETLHATLVIKQDYLMQKEVVSRLEQSITQAIAQKDQECRLVIERDKVQMHHLESLGTSMQGRLDALEKERTAVIKSLGAIEKKQQDLLGKTQNIEQLEQQFEKRKTFYQNLVAMGNQFSIDINNLERKKQLSSDDDNPCCPLCEQNLSAARRRFLKEKFAHEEHFIRHRIARVTRILTKLKQVLIEQHSELKSFQEMKAKLQECIVIKAASVSRLDEIMAEIISCQDQKKVITSQLGLIIDAIKKQEKSSLDEQQKCEHDLRAQDVYRAEIEKLRFLEGSLNSIKYDAKVHDALRTELVLIEKDLAEYSEVLSQVLFQEQRKRAIHLLCCDIRKMREAIAMASQNLIIFKQLDEREKHVKDETQEIVRTTAEISRIKGALLQEKGALEKERDTLFKLEQEHTSHSKRIGAISELIDDFQAISTATGKDGIQALLIHDILPELEREANCLLAKLTDNQAQLFIESLRDLKKGGSKETLDINISDAMGLRPYEMFSGGEAFRIDFALRVALSKLLACRAGTSLQTLIIDEGFGSQDEEGLGHIMDVLYKIQDDFAKIIVVSHLTSMKDQFPVQFFVEKRTSGSVITVIEQG